MKVFQKRRTIVSRVEAIVLMLFWALSISAQDINVQGRVTSASDGGPLPGVAVVVSGTTRGSVTDGNGNYSIECPSDATLLFSFIGYEAEEIMVNGQNQIDVVMLESLEMLQDVVVIGYGTMKRKDVTSSITTVSAEDLNQGVYTDPAQLLQGKVPGLVISDTSDPNGSASISLRGASSLRKDAAMEPYYVIDGIPGVSLALIAPQDIESIDVLRDASATAIYGSKAANGVIIITTKKGSKDGKTNVNYNGYVAFDKALNTLDMMSADELLSYAKANNVDLSSFYDVEHPYDTDWQDEVLHIGVSNSHSVSINGGNDHTQYSASVNYINKEGALLGSKMDRLNARAFLKTTTLKEHLDLSFNVNASITNRRHGATGGNGQSVIDAACYYLPLVPVKNEDGSWYNNTTISQNYNPLSMVYEDVYKTREKRLQGSGATTLHIIENLDWNANFSYQTQQWIWNNYNSSKTQLPSVATRNGQAERITSEDNLKSFETYANYKFDFDDESHKFDLMAGYSWEQEDNSDGFGLKVYNFYNDNTSYYNLGLANNIDINDGIISYQLSTLRMISFYGRLNYSYNSKYLLQATIRRDGSSAFGKNNRWGTFPAFSAAWRAIEEDFLQSQNVLSDLKFRIGYGVSGNSLGFGAYEAIETYGAIDWFTYEDPETGNSSQYRTISATKNANPDLKWERTSMLNVGVDFGFLNNRLTGTVEFYNKKTSDLIYTYAVSTNRYPYGWMTANVGDISNKGFELTLTAVPVEAGDWRWSTTLNLSHNKNVVESLSNDTYSVDFIDVANPDVSGYTNKMAVQRIKEGGPIGQFYLWEWAGYDDEGKSLFNDYDEDGNLIGTTDSPDDTDRSEHGCAQPKVTFGWNNSITYKKLTLDAFFRGTAGNKIYNATRNYYNNVTLMQSGKNMLSEVATMQRATDTRAQAPSDRYLENGSYLRLATLTLSYNHGNIGEWLQNLKVYATCNNVFTITKYEGLDPEVYLGGLEPGVDWRNSHYPRTRSFILGIDVTF